MEEMSSLNNDIYFDVLSRLPTKILLGLKCVSKGWHHLISGRSFIQTQLLTTEPVVSGFIFQEKLQLCNEDIETFNYIPVETEGSVRKVAFNFLVENVVVLASCNGLVCCRSCFPSQDPSIYICNPLIKDWVRVEWTAPKMQSNIGLAFDPSQNPIDISTNFKVVQAQRFGSDDKEQGISFEIYSSETRAWRMSNEICMCSDSLLKNNSIFIKGVLHWLTNGDKILTFDVEEELSFFVSVPIPEAIFNTTQTCIGDSEGQLHFVMVSEEGLHIWCLEDYFESRWTLKHSKSLEKIREEHPRFFCNSHDQLMHIMKLGKEPMMDPLAFKDGILLMRVAAMIYSYNLSTGKIKEVCSLTRLGQASMFCPTVLAYSMSLIPLT